MSVYFYEITYLGSHRYDSFIDEEKKIWYLDIHISVTLVQEDKDEGKENSEKEDI